ncbi:MAG: DUF1987 domain-containing protein [Bacteroidota bacterium]
MEKIALEGTEERPSVILDKTTGKFEIAGKSYMEDVATFYHEIIDWLEDYGKEPNALTVFEFRLDYRNTSSSKMIIDVIEILHNINKSGHDVLVKWCYYADDEDIKQIGRDFSEIYQLPFVFDCTDSF